MDKEPLLPFTNHTPRLRPPPPPPPPLRFCSLPENYEYDEHGEQDELSFPTTVPMTPSELKDHLIFGPFTPSPHEPSSSAASSSMVVEALTLSQTSPRIPSPIATTDSSFDFPKSNLHRSRTAPAMAGINEIAHDHHPSSESNPKFGQKSVVSQAFVLLVIYLSFGVMIYWVYRKDFSVNETHPVVDALYFCIVTMCTIGYGDITPNSTPTKLFSILFVLVGFGFVDILLSGMVSYVLDLQETYLLRNAQRVGDGKETAGRYIIDVKKGRMRIRMKVGLALGVVVLCIGVGVGVMHFIEQLGWVDSLYLSVMSVTTVGYGDRAFESMHGRIFASIWLLVSTLAVARAFLYLAEARVDRRQRRMAKWVLGHDMTVSEFLAADIDHNGYVSKSEYVIYKLKEMGKVSEKDVRQICENFDRIDSGNLGKITLNDLIAGQP